MANLTFSHNFLSQAFLLGALPPNAFKVTHNACYAGYIFMWSSNPGYAALIALAFFIPDNFPSSKRRMSNFGVKSKLFKWLRVCLRCTSLFWSWKASVFQNIDWTPPPPTPSPLSYAPSRAKPRPNYHTKSYSLSKRRLHWTHQWLTGTSDQLYFTAGISGVDMMFEAHEHSYERLWPIYDMQVRLLLTFQFLLKWTPHIKTLKH